MGDQCRTLIMRCSDGVPGAWRALRRREQIAGGIFTHSAVRCVRRKLIVFSERMDPEGYSPDFRKWLIVVVGAALVVIAVVAAALLIPGRGDVAPNSLLGYLPAD